MYIAFGAVQAPKWRLRLIEEETSLLSFISDLHYAKENGDTAYN